jgi:hypothetical protein
MRDVVIGDVYEVYAIEFRDSGYWFFLHVTKSKEYPLPYPAEFFEVVDSNIPTGWSMKFELELGQVLLKRISYEEWAKDDTYFENLIDGDAECVSIFKRQFVKNITGS